MIGVCVMRDEGVHRREREDEDDWRDEEEGGVSYFTPWRDQFLYQYHEDSHWLILVQRTRDEMR